MSEETKGPADELPRGVRKTARGWEIDLDYPIERVSGETTERIKTLTMRRSNVGDSEAMARYADKDDAQSLTAAGLLLASRLLGLTDDEVRTIDNADWPRIEEAIQSHMGGQRSGGPT
jgi:hypothetical protein